MGREPGEPVFSTPAPHVALQRVRSTLLVASYKMVRAMGRDDDYRLALAPEYHATILSAVAGTWVAVDVVLAHYRACEALGLSADAQVEVGRTVGRQVRGTLAGTLVHMSKQVGVAPWTVLPTLPRFWSRVFDGGAILDWRLGPKEVRIDAVKMPLFDFDYFRNACRGQVMGLMDLFCTRSYVTARGTSFQPGTYSVRVQWA